MDSNKNQTKQTFEETKKKLLTLEARHSISIEASNKIRSKLNPRLFIPRSPSSRSKSILKSENLENLTAKELRSFQESQTENTVKSPNVKYTKKLHYKTMENNNLHVFRSRYQSIKILKKNKLKTPSGFKRFTLAVEMEKDDIAKDDTALSSRENLKIIENENSPVSPKYLAKGEVIYFDDLLALNSPKSVKKDETPCAVQNLQTNDDESNSPKLQIVEDDTNVKEMCTSLNSQTKKTKNAKQSKAKIFKNTTTCNKIDDIDDLKVKVKKKSTKPVVKYTASKNRSNTAPNLNESLSKKENSKTLHSETILRDILKNNPSLPESLNKLTIQISTDKTDKVEKSFPSKKIIAGEKMQEQQLSNTEKPLGTIYKTNQNVINKKTTRNPLESYLYTATTGVADFQNAVRSSISQIYDCSPMDQKINEDLIDLDNSAEHFSKYALQCYNDADKEGLKTNNYIEYLRKKGLDRIAQPLQNRSHNSSFLNQSKSAEETTETLTIFIDADAMPTKSITFKTSDILYPKLNSESNDGTIKNSVVSLENNTANTNVHQVDTQNQRAMEMPKSITNSSRPRKKVQRKALKDSTSSANSSLSSTQIQTSALPALGQGSNNAFEQNSLNNTFLWTNQYNLIYTQALNDLNSHSTTNSPGSSHEGAITRCSSSTNSQVPTASPVINLYNYSLGTERVDSVRIIENPRPHLYLYPMTQNLIREQPSPMINEHQTRFEYQNSMQRVPYLQNPYTQPRAQLFQMENNSGTLGTENVPILEN